MEELSVEEILRLARKSEIYARTLLEALETRGIYFSRPIETLSHQECILALREIYRKLEQRRGLH